MESPKALTRNHARDGKLDEIESILERTEWPPESNEAAERLLGAVRRIPRWKLDYYDVQKETRAVQNVLEKVNEASSMYRGPLRQMKARLGGGVKSCTKILTACREELISAIPVADVRPPPGSPSHPPPPPSPPPPSPPPPGVPLLRAPRLPSRTSSSVSRHSQRRASQKDYESQQQSSRLGAKRPTVFVPSRSVSYVAGVGQHWVNPSLESSASSGSTSIASMVHFANAEQKWVGPSSEGAVVSSHSSKPILSRIADVRQQETVPITPRIRHKSLPPTPRDDESHQPWSNPRGGISADPISSSSAASASVPDVGTKITWISPMPVKVNVPFCDIFTGIHSSVGKVALTRPRIEATGNNGDPVGRFQQEATAWERLRHPHILESLGTFQRDGHFYFVSRFIEKGSLIEYIVLDPNVNRIKLLCDTADAISYLHKEEVVHGDIRASNVLIGDGSQVLLCASSRGLTSPAGVTSPIDMAGAGSLRWQSPELMVGAPKSFKSDVYAFGMTIAEVLTGDVPFSDLRTDGDVISAVRIKGRRPPRKPAGSAGLSYEKVWAVAKACWRTTPEKRISMSEALQMIQEDPALPVIPTLRGDERQQHRSSLRGGSYTTRASEEGSSARSHPTHRPPMGMGIVEDDSEEENSAPSSHALKRLIGALEDDSEGSLPSSWPQTMFVASEEPQLAGLGEGVSAVSLSSSITASGSVADVGTQITWISPTPVKLNGHFCDLFAGTHSGVGKVALKRPRIGAPGNNEDVMRRFQREAETWARLGHPHILEYLGTFQRDGHFYFVSPFIENGTLVEYIVLHPSVNRIKLLCETADAISYLHKENLVHGDIKGSSLLFGDNGQVLLCASANGLTMPVDIRTSTEVKEAGTLRWQSPELLEGGSKSFKSDVYAFGMTIAEVLTGDVPFPDLLTDKAIISTVRIEGKRPPKNPAVSSAGLSYGNVWAVAEACWSIIPENRISMSEALQMIQEDPALTVTQADPALPAIQEITSSSLVVDVGSFVTSISNDAVKLNGHFCDVFEGIHSTAGRVALKRPRIAGTGEEDGTMRRFEREAVIWQRLRHPHILEFLGTFRRNGHLYLVSRFVNNGTLVEYTASHPRTNRIRLLCETADALKYLHNNDIVHGDIKGTNILIDDNIHCLLCDFGLSKMTHSRTSTAMRGAGTSRWQSPELLQDAPKSFSSDAYAFAMTIAEVLTGKAPFAHLKNEMTVMYAVLDRDERPPKNPTESPSGVSYLGAWDVAEACWSKNPEERISMSIAFQRLQADPSSSIS